MVCVLADNGLSHEIMENKIGLVDVITLEYQENKQALLKLPADEREHTASPPPDPGAPGSVQLSLEEMMIAKLIGSSGNFSSFLFFFLFLRFMSQSFQLQNIRMF